MESEGIQIVSTGVRFVNSLLQYYPGNVRLNSEGEFDTTNIQSPAGMFLNTTTKFRDEITRKLYPGCRLLTTLLVVTANSRTFGFNYNIVIKTRGPTNPRLIQGFNIIL